MNETILNGGIGGTVGTSTSDKPTSKPSPTVKPSSPRTAKRDAVQEAEAAMLKILDRVDDSGDEFAFALEIVKDCPVGSEFTQLPCKVSADGQKSSIALSRITDSDNPALIERELLELHVADPGETVCDFSGRADTKDKLAVKRGKKKMTALHAAALVHAMRTKNMLYVPGESD